MRAPLALLVALLVALLACGKDKAAPPAPSSGKTESVDWSACDTALAAAADGSIDTALTKVIDGCHVCGDWTPILRWNTPQAQGGPKQADIEAAMVRCSAFCTGDAKLKFLGTLDDARGTSSRTPWRQLAEICKDKVSAVPDQRFSSGPYFALDRIARAISQRGGDTAKRAAALVLPLPALTVVGTGPVLPDVEGAFSPDPRQVQITLLGGDTFVGVLPTAKLGANGVEVSMGADPYPGKKVAAGELASALKTLVTGPTQAILLLVPPATAAQTVIPVVAAASPIASVYLAAGARGAPDGWTLPAAIPVALVAGGDAPVAVSATMTVQQLADELAKKVQQKVQRVGIAAP